MPDLNPTAASLLGFLLEKPLTGWDIVESVERSIGYFWNLTRSQVYRELKTLAEAGYVVLGTAGPRDRQPYAITRAGREAFHAWIGQEPGGETLRFPFLLTVFFGTQVDPAALRRYTANFRARHAAQLAEYERIDCELPASQAHAREALRFGMVYERAVLAWADSARWSAAGGEATKPAGAKPKKKKKKAKR